MAHKDSENVLVNWRNPKLAKVYLEHFERNYRQATPYQLRYCFPALWAWYPWKNQRVIRTLP